MFEISPLSSQVGRTATQLYRTAGGPKPQQDPTNLSPDDQVELSGAARSFDGTTDAPNAMDERIRTLREQIAAGVYLTDDKLNHVVDRLHAELFPADTGRG
jgi:hypothetical protein